MPTQTEIPKKYCIKEHVIVNGWGSSSSGIIADIDWVYHHRLNQYCWGYRINWDEDKHNPFIMTYIPEGYLKKDIAKPLIESLEEI